jgi:hypothetical protein
VGVHLDSDDDTFRIKGHSDAVWRAYTPPNPAAGTATKNFFLSGNGTTLPQAKRPPSLWLSALHATGILVLPVIGLLIALIATWLYRATAVDFLDGMFGHPSQPVSAWLTVGYMLIGATYFPIHLTNRRYGPSYAIGQILIAWLLVGAGVAALQWNPDLTPQDFVLPSFRLSAGLGFALFFSQIVAAVLFDSTRGVRWWQAPLFGSFWASFVFVLLFYPAAYAGTEIAWLSRTGVHFGVLVGLGVLLLIPYWLCRSLVRPLPGYGGY